MAEIADVVNNSLANKRVMLFLGSGFSVGAKNTLGNNIPTGGQFAGQLYSDCAVAGDSDLQYAAELYIKTKSYEELLQKLRATFTITEYEAYYNNIFKHSFFRIYTTNYDDLFEKTAAKNGQSFVPVSIEQNISGYKDKSKLVIHINGSIGNVNPKNMENYFKLTSQSYLVDTIRQSTWYEQLKADIAIADEIFFLGFSLDNDLDIKRLIFIDEVCKRKVTFIVWDKEPQLSIQKLSRYGQVFPCGIQKFAETLANINAIRKPELTPNAFQCFEAVNFVDTINKPIKDSDTFDLLFYGKLSLDILSQTIQAGTFVYALFRKEATEVVEAIKQGKYPIIHADMGNGKTIFIYQVALMLSKAGYNVFTFKRPYQTIDEEIDAIMKLPGKTIVIIDRYYLFFSTTRRLLALGTPDIQFILTERSSIFDISISRIEEATSIEHYDIDLNKIDLIDVPHFVALITKYNFWGDKSKLTSDEKQALFESKYRRQIRLFLLDVLRSEDIRKRIGNLIGIFSANENAFKLFVLLLVSDIIGLNASIDDLFDLLGYSIDISQLRLDSNYREILDFGSGEVFLKSSILSQSMIELLEDNDVLLATIKIAARNASLMKSTLSQNFIKELSIFSNLEAIFRNKALHRRNIVSFYEIAKEFEQCKGNPHFWVQYAIAMISLDDLNLADVYIRNAYSIAQGMTSFDVTQIDNQYSRLLMEKCIREDRTDHYDILLKVHGLISSPRSLRDNKYYPYRVARKYYDYYEKYYGKLDINQKRNFISLCEVMHRSAENTLRRTTSEISRKKICDFIYNIEIVLKATITDKQV